MNKHNVVSVTHIEPPFDMLRSLQVLLHARNTLAHVILLSDLALPN